MTAYQRGFALACVLVTAGIQGCGTSPDDGFANEANPGQSAAKLRGGTIVTGATGIVDFYYDPGNNNCTGNMISPHAVLTAAHCFDALGATTTHDGTVDVVVNYYYPASGRAEAYRGPAEWHVYPTYDGALNPAGPGGSNDDMGLLVIPDTFALTNYHDYLRLYADVDGPLDAKLTTYGAGIYTYSGHEDDNLRTTWFQVESVDINHIVVDTRDLQSLCRGDSGGPLIKMGTHGGVDFPLVVAVNSKSELDSSDEGPLCTNNDPPYNDAFFCRVNSTRVSWIEDKLGRPCIKPTNSANLIYKRCFDTPLMEDVPGEDRELNLEVAIAMSVL